MDKIFALFDSDVFYATRFMEYFTRNEIPGFEVVVFSQLDSIQSYISEHVIEVLLLGEQVNLEETALENIRQVYQLSDGKYQEADERFPSILKYQSVKEVINKVLSDYTHTRSNINHPDPSHKTILSIYAPLSQLETLSFAWSLNTIMSERNKVLFVLLDLYPIKILSMQNSNNQNLSDFIYYLKENTNIADNLRLLVQNFTWTGGSSISYLSGIHHSSDLLSLSREDIQHFTEELRRNSQYDSVIIYTNYASDAIMELMNLSDSVCITSLDTAYERAVVQEWDRQMERVGISTRNEKYKFVTLRQEDSRKRLPLTIEELIQSQSWESARLYLS